VSEGGGAETRLEQWASNSNGATHAQIAWQGLGKGRSVHIDIDSANHDDIRASAVI